MTDDTIHETINDISVSTYRVNGWVLTRRWRGTASAKWGSVGTGRGYRLRRTAKLKLIEAMDQNRPTVGSDLPAVLIAAAKGSIKAPNSDLQLIDLTERNIANSNLTNSNLNRAEMARINLHNSNLSFCNLAYVNLTGANLDSANLTGAAFFSSNLTGASFCTVYQSTTSAPPQTNRSIPIEGWTGFLYFVDCDLTNCNFNDADLRGSFFKRCNLTNTRFENAHLNDTRFIDCDFTSTTLPPLETEGFYVGPPRNSDPADHLFP